jgi:hypothetical protein
MNEAELLAMLVDKGIPELIQIAKLILDEVHKRATASEVADAAVGAVELAADVDENEKFAKK